MVRDINFTLNIKTISIIVAIMSILLGGGLTWQLDPLDVHTSNCSYFKLREGMNNDQKEVFNFFVDNDFCEIGDCQTGYLYSKTEKVLKDVWKENPEFHKRIVYYLETCKEKNGK